MTKTHCSEFRPIVQSPTKLPLLKHQLHVWESSGPPSLQTCWLQIQGSPGTSLSLIIYWTDSQNSGKPYTCDYSFTVTKGYKLKPAKRRATQGKIWEEPKCEASGCLSLGSYGQCYLLLAKMYDNTRILPTREAYPGIWYLKFISWFNHMLPAWLTFSFQLLPEGRLTHLVLQFLCRSELMWCVPKTPS